MKNYIYGKKLCNKYLLSYLEIAKLCHEEQINCYDDKYHHQIYSSKSKNLIKKNKHKRTNSVYGLKYNNVNYIAFVINEKNLDFDNYFTLHYPKYLDANSTKDTKYELMHDVPSEFLWWLHIKDENSLKEELKKHKKIKTHLSYSVFFKYSMTKIASCIDISLHLDFENLKSEYFKKISRPKSEEIKSIHDYTEINNFSELIEKKMISESDLKDYGFHDTKNVSWENLEFREDVDLNIIIYNDINNQLTIKITNNRTPTTVTNAPFLNFMKEIPNKEKILHSNDQKLNYHSEFLPKSPLIQTDDTLFTGLYLLPKHFNISIFEERKISEYLTLLDYDYYSPNSMDRALELISDYYIFQPIRLRKLHYFVNSELFEDEFIKFIHQSKFIENEHPEFFYNKKIKNDPLNISIKFWKDFLKKNELIMSQEIYLAISLYINKIEKGKSYKELHDTIYGNMFISDAAKNKAVSRNLKKFETYAEKLGLSEYIIKNLEKNKSLNVKRNSNCPSYSDGKGDAGICS